MLNASVLDQYPGVDTDAAQILPEKKYRQGRHKIVVLDDDPAGVQTVHDVFAYMGWPYDSTKKDFEKNGKLFYIPMNSREFTAEQTTRAHLEIGETAAKVSKETGTNYVIVSRGDPTLRGHYPLGTELPVRAEGKHRSRAVDEEIVCPYFKEGGRFAIDNVHYVKYGNELVSVGEIEFTEDKTFGYHYSDLGEYVEEKIGGRYPARGVLDVSLEKLRSLDYASTTDKLPALHGFGKIVVGAVDAYDLKVFCIAFYNTMNQGRRSTSRIATGFMRESGAIRERPLLPRKEMVQENCGTGGIVMVGSHTKKITSQLETLKTVEGIRFIEFNSDLVLDEEKFQEEISSAISQEGELIGHGVTIVVYTRGKLLPLEHDSPEGALVRPIRISDVVQSPVNRLKVRPAFVAAKGGTTSSDVGVKALQVKRAAVSGQIRPGVSVWRTDPENRFPGTPYIMFSSNVGEVETLKGTVEILLG